MQTNINVFILGFVLCHLGSSSSVFDIGVSPSAFDSFSFISVFKFHALLPLLIVSYCLLLSANVKYRYAEII